VPIPGRGRVYTTAFKGQPGLKKFYVDAFTVTENTPRYLEAVYFSIVTWTTLGYGGPPLGLWQH
jgi:hypothetical protein